MDCVRCGKPVKDPLPKLKEQMCDACMLEVGKMMQPLVDLLIDHGDADGDEFEDLNPHNPHG